MCDQARQPDHRTQQDVYVTLAKLPDWAANYPALLALRLNHPDAFAVIARSTVFTGGPHDPTRP